MLSADVKNDIGFLIKKLHDEIGKKANLIFKDFGLTISQSYVLHYLHENIDKTVSQKELEKHMNVSHPTIVGILSRLESKGLIEFRFDEKDKRVKNVYLSNKKSGFDEAMEIFRISTEKELSKILTQQEKSQLISTLSKMLNELKK